MQPVLKTAELERSVSAGMLLSDGASLSAAMYAEVPEWRLVPLILSKAHARSRDAEPYHAKAGCPLPTCAPVGGADQHGLNREVRMTTDSIDRLTGLGPRVFGRFPLKKQSNGTADGSMVASCAGGRLRAVKLQRWAALWQPAPVEIESE